MTDPIQRVNDALGSLEAALEALWEPMDEPLGLDDLTYLAMAVEAHKKVVGALASALEGAILNLMPEKVVTTLHARLEKFTTATKQTWDAPMLVSVLSKAAVDQREVDEETGELESPVNAITRAMTDCAAVSYFRLGALEVYGIDGRKYRQTEWGRKRVKITAVQPSQEGAPGVPSQTSE